MHEDWFLDRHEYEAECCDDLFREEGVEEVLRLMIPCKNCGELRPRDDPEILRTGCCYLCNKSDFHREKRATSDGCSANTRTLAKLVEKLEDSRW